MIIKHKRFCLNLKKGMSKKDAAIAAGYPESYAGVAASKILKKEDVRDYMATIEDRIENKEIASIEERQTVLTQVLREEAVGDKLKAIDLLNKMTSVYVTRIEADIETVIRVSLDDEEE